MTYCWRCTYCWFKAETDQPDAPPPHDCTLGSNAKVVRDYKREAVGIDRSWARLLHQQGGGA